MSVQFHPTPNPNAGKFTIGRPSVPTGGSKSYFTAEQASGDPLAEPLFAIEGVTSVFMVSDFVTVTKSESADWGALIPQVCAALEQAG